MTGKQWIGPWIAALGGALWCSAYTQPLIDPLRLDVVLQGDWAQHTLGWLFFRREPIGFPLGRIRDYLHPFGTTLGFMDSIPWLALVLRPFSDLLPDEFQYLGLWMLFCSSTLAWTAARVSALSTRCWEQQALAGLLVAMAPSLLDRIVHPALCAHFLLLLAFLLHLTPSNSPGAARRVLWGSLALLVLSAATHPYLAFMVLAIVIGLPVRLLRHVGVVGVLALSVAMLVSVACVLMLFGYLGGDVRVRAGGFGEFSANLNTYINSMGHSRMFRGLRTGPLQYEGYSYLGAGCLFTIAAAACLLLSHPARMRIFSFPWRRALWPLVAAGALAVFALATPWQWGGKEVVTIRLYERIEWLTQLFRSSGRMAWPLAYLLDLAAVTALLRALSVRRWAATAALAVAVALQAYDIDLAQTGWVTPAATKRRHSSRAWSLAAPSFKHLVLYPAEIQDACESPGGYRADEVNALAYLAYRRGWTINSGYAARLQRGTAEYCEQLDQQVRAGALREDTIYVVRRRLKMFRRAGATCGEVDHTAVCVVSKDDPFAAFLAQHKR